MASIEDVVVGSVWRWTSQPGGACVSDRRFTIVHVDGNRARYEYPSLARQSRPIFEIITHAEPVCAPAPAAKCAPDCTPARACWADHVCPAWSEPNSLARMDADKQHAFRRGTLERLAREREPVELRCGRDLACGLWRIP